MKDSSATIHTTHRDQRRHFHFLLLLIPSIVFALTLAFFLRNKWGTPITPVAPKVVTHEITVGTFPLTVRVAKTQAEQAQGLSGVTSLPDNEGMIFVFPGKARPPFWMKDMQIGLDFIWTADGKVTQVIEDVPAPAPGTPDSKLKLYIPNDLVDAVIEVKQGFVKKNNIKVGDSVDFSSIN